MIYLQGEPAAAGAAEAGARQARLLGHWGSDPGLSFVYIHLNRLIKKYDLDVIFVRAGPRRAGAALERLSGGHVLRDLPG